MMDSVDKLTNAVYAMEPILALVVMEFHTLVKRLTAVEYVAEKMLVSIVMVERNGTDVEYAVATMTVLDVME